MMSTILVLNMNLQNYTLKLKDRPLDVWAAPLYETPFWSVIRFQLLPSVPAAFATNCLASHLNVKMPTFGLHHPRSVTLSSPLIGLQVVPVVVRGPHSSHQHTHTHTQWTYLPVSIHILRGRVYGRDVWGVVGDGAEVVVEDREEGSE